MEPIKKLRATYQDVLDAPEHMLPTRASEEPGHYEHGWY